MPHEEVLEWIEKADEGLEAARRLLSGEPLTAPAAFHCQQASEKALKAFLVSRGERPPRVHNLTFLIELCEEHEVGFRDLREEVGRLNPFAVDERYPGPRDPPSQLATEGLLETAEEVFEPVQTHLDH